MLRIIALSLLAFAAGLSEPGAEAADIANRPTLTLEGAKAIATSAIRYAHEHQAPGAAVAMVDSGGTLLYVERLDQTFQNAANISIGKARTAVAFGKPTRVFEDLVNKGRYTMLALPEIAPFTPLMGGVPIEIEGHVVGAIGVSGASSAAQDDEIATAAAAEFANNQPHHTAEVIIVPRAIVKAGFTSDATLLEEADFRVNASHRTGPGEPEIHLNDTDIFYVLEGRADLIVGGVVRDQRSLSAGEIRGSKIEGGEMRTIEQGDVVTIPRGTPHWFKQVSTPFTYYVVKSTHNG